MIFSEPGENGKKTNKRGSIDSDCYSSGLIHLPRALQRQDSEIVALSEDSSLSLPPIDFEQEVWEERIQQNSSIEPIGPDLKRDGEKFETIERRPTLN